MKAYDDIMKGLNEQLAELYKGLASIAEIREKAEGAFTEISERVTEIVNAMQDSATKYLESATESAKLTTDAVREQKEAQTAIVESLKNDFEIFDQQMQEEVARIIQVMANKLGAINDHFVNDYQPLLEKWREIIEAADRTK